LIAESEYWKDDLLRYADYLEQRRSARRWTERTTARVEKAIMVGCFVIRRLHESRGRLSDSTVRRRVHAIQYPRTGGHIPTLLNWSKLDRHFALHSPRPKTLAVIDLCNQFIHSYVFMPVLNSRGGLHALLVASDSARTKALYEVSIEAIVRIFRRAGNDYPDTVHSTFDQTLGDYVVHAGTSFKRDQKVN